MVDNLASNPKLFDVYTSLFSVVRHIYPLFIDLNKDFIKKFRWTCQWKISFTPDAAKRYMKSFLAEKVKRKARTA